MIPLRPEKVVGIWHAIKGYEFESTHGGFAGTDLFDAKLKERVLESARIQIRAVGGDDSVLLR